MIDQEAVEAGARALHHFTGAGPWGQLVGHRQDALRAQVREVLDDALPHLLPPIPYRKRAILPKLTVYVPADVTPRFGWNRYYAGTVRQVTIGAGFVAFGRCYSLQWRRP